MAALEAVVEQIGHGVELHRAAAGREGIAHGAGASPAAADQGQLDGAVLAGVDRRQRHPGQRRDRRRAG